MLSGTATTAAATAVAVVVNAAQLPLPTLLHRSTWPARRTSCIARTSLYDLLGVSSSASTPEIRAAYRRLAARYHPDVNTSLAAHEKFQALNLAAEVLTSELRQQYDSRGVAVLPGSRYGSLLDFLRNVRGPNGAASLLGEPGGDISTVLGLGFPEAVTGSEASVTTGALGACPDCKGSGQDPTHRAADCRVCRGSGEILVRRWDPQQHQQQQQHREAGPVLPVLTLAQPCPACRGIGRSETHDCTRCAGEGRVQLRRRVRFKVPAGVVDGQVLRVKGQGHSGQFGGAPGDLLVKLQVYDLPDVTRRGDDLHSVLQLGLYEALLGGLVHVTTVRGQRQLQVPPGTQHGQRLCVRGAGVARPGVNGVEYGHHFFQVAVQVPSADGISPPELQLLRQLAALLQAQQGQQEDREAVQRRHLHRQRQSDQQGQPQQQGDVQEQQDAASAAQPQASVPPLPQQQQDHPASWPRAPTSLGDADAERGGGRQRQQSTAAAGEHSCDPP